MAAAEDALRAVSAGEIDAFIVSDGDTGQRVFTLSTADRPYRIFVENMPDGAATLSPSGLILYANRRLAELLSCPRESIVGSSLATFMTGDVPIGLHQIRGPGGLGATVETELLDGDGMAVPVLVGSSFLDVDGVQMTCLTFTDLSVQKAQGRAIAALEAQAEQERVQVQAERDQFEARRRQSERLESLGQLAGGVAHDFNNLLAVILNYATFVSEELTSATGSAERTQAANDVEQIRRAAQRAVGLIHQLLAFARQEVIQPETIDLNEAVRGVEEMLRRTLGADMKLIFDLPADLSPILADRGQIDQILVNLAVNARDAMPGGGTLTIDTADVEVDDDSVAGGSAERVGRYVRLRVSDTGSGMPPDVIDHAFEPFFTTKRNGEGTGLGLATVYGIVARADGTITIQSAPDVGTTFTIMIPVTDKAAAATVHEQASYEPTPKGKTVLIVDDEAALLELTERIFSRNGYRVITAANGPDAITLVAHHDGEIHLLVTDVVMPHMLGKELAERILDLRPEIAVLYMSGYAQRVLASQGRLEPGVVLIDKPFSESAMLEKAGQVLNGHFGGYTNVST
jgi:signal transduction histidine kinase/CheY-like chemotaxis protein